LYFKENTVTITQKNRLMLFTEIITVNTKRHMSYKSTLSGEKVKTSDLKRGIICTNNYALKGKSQPFFVW